MIRKMYLVILFWVTLSGWSLAQENYLIVYGGFAGFQVPVWATKDQDEGTIDELEREGFFKRLAERSPAK